MNFVFEPAATPSVAVVGEIARFPVRRIFCVGRNYAAHAREMGRNPDREPPFFFTKPADALVAGGVAIPYPPLTNDLHYEAELVVAIGKGGAAIQPANALDHIYGYAVGNDLTRRDLQLAAREQGRPWDWGKAFDRSAVCGPIRKIADTGPIEKGAITLSVNGEVRQSADISELIWPVADVVTFLSQSVRIEPGDVVFTGTPAGVGPLVPNDICVVAIDGLGEISTEIVQPGVP